MEYLSLVPVTALSYLTFRATTHPHSKIRNKLPNIKVKRIQVFPVIRVHMFGRWIHFHHWMNFSVLLALSGFTSIGVLDHTLIRGLLLGGIIQGLSIPRSYRKFIYKELIN